MRSLITLRKMLREPSLPVFIFDVGFVFHNCNNTDYHIFFQCITAGLVHHKPEDPVAFIKKCLAFVKDNPDTKVNLLLLQFLKQ